MSGKTNLIPKNEDVAEIVKRSFGENAIKIERFLTGSCHFVFDVETDGKRKIVVRISKPENQSFLKNALYWSELLRPKGIPLPKILAFDLGETTFPYIVLERLKGKDLGLVYKQLKKSEKKSLAIELAKIQNMTATLPKAKSFGFVENYETNSLCRNWTDVLRKSLDRSRNRIEDIGIFNAKAVDRVEEKLVKFENYFSQIEPIGFLDDITTKNVIVDEGKLSGIVDVDNVCFGDNLLTIALTRMSLILSNDDLDYIKFWTSEINYNAEKKRILDFYTALFCVDFMSEIGQTFNKETPLQIDEEKFARLHLILGKLLVRI